MRYELSPSYLIILSKPFYIRKTLSIYYSLSHIPVPVRAAVRPSLAIRLDFMRVLDLFCGTKSWSKVYENTTIISIDLDYKHSPSLTRNILTFDYKKEVPEPIDIIYASPPCDLYFSPLKAKSGLIKYTEIDKQLSLEMVDKTIEIIKFFDPKVFVIENPRGKMRKHYPDILGHKYQTVFYCVYGFEYQKPTDIWTNLSLEAKQCVHKTHKFGIKNYIRKNQPNPYEAQGMSKALRKVNNSRIPQELTIEIMHLATERMDART